MEAFLSFHAPGFWLVITLLAGVVVLGIRPYLGPGLRLWSMVGCWVLLPYLALITGGVSPRLMGIAYVDWIVSLRLGIGLAVVMIGLAGVARMSLLTSGETVQDRAALMPITGGSLLAAIAMSGAEEWFWCFLRSAVAEALGILQLPLDVPGYWSIWIAALIALPFSLAYQPTALHRFVKAAILVMTSILFFYTRNFWLCWAVHATTWLLLAQPAANRVITRKSRV
jgi:hypothetical protein